MVTSLLCSFEKEDLFQEIQNHQFNVLYSSLQSDNVIGMEEMICEWYTHYLTKYDELETYIEFEYIIRQIFLSGANFASIKCLEYIQTHYPRNEEDLSMALLLVCNLTCTRKDDIVYYSTTEVFRKRTGERKKETQYSLIKWLVSQGANIYYESRNTDCNSPIEERKTFINVVQTLLWYHNIELLDRLCVDGLKISEEDLSFLLTMLESQDNFPFIEENFLCISKHVTSTQIYHLLLEMSSYGEYFLMKIFYSLLEDSYKSLDLYVELFHRCPSYITRQWITETIGIDNQTFNDWIKEYDRKERVIKKRKINFLYKIHQKEAKCQ
jgi:hypothetical protein